MTEETEIIDAEIEEEVRNLPAVRAAEAIVVRGELSVDEVVAQKDKIQQVMERVMKKDVHYGVIPGVNKPSLLKPGAEAINVALRLAAHYESEKIWHDDGHLTVVAKCELRHIPTGLVVGTGEGLCTTRESRYAYRKGARACPNCGEPQIKRSKYKPKTGDYDGADPDDEPGWYCWKKEGGCGMNFAADDTRITSQSEGKIANPELADTYNTVLKMADKRALIAADLNATAASDIFTQDVEDQPAAAAPEADGGNNVSPVAKDSQTENAPQFDPSKDLLPNAIQGSGKDEVAMVESKLRVCNDLVDWKGTIGAATKTYFGKEKFAELSDEEKKEWWFRLRNAVAKLEEIAHPDLGASPDYVRYAFGFGFSRTREDVEVVMLPKQEEFTNGDENVPFRE